ncbi:hypothetical protein [Nocardioides aurantiacus]|uniref:Uncharacterized protein n=1 Tax=Nocardioides aurantiacus TaxID=86796 RepID=A0A3N2CTM5_9ACTN|nr:hypothetical protein [Nocardioides aurantiacus]ROR90887.1 hypothetical protein EDD33_1736 [Nocardioides aurantiacus]
MDREQADAHQQDLERLEIFDALVAAGARRDEVLQLVSQAPDPDAAVQAIQDLLHIAEVPAAAVIDLQIRHLTISGRERVLASRDELRAQIEGRR